MTDPHQPDADEALLTAYALGELSADERVAFEAAWGTSLDRRAALAEACAEISRAAQILSTALAQEPTPALERPMELSQPAVVEAPVIVPISRENTSSSYPNIQSKGFDMSYTKVGIAAAVLLAVGIGGSLMLSTQYKASSVAMKRADMAVREQVSSSPAYMSDDVAYEAVAEPRDSVHADLDVSRAPEPKTERPSRGPTSGNRPRFYKETAPGAGGAVPEVADIALPTPTTPPESKPPFAPPPRDAEGAPDRAPGQNLSGERYTQITENDFLRVGQNPLSTFSIDVDTASYSNMRRHLQQNQRPRPDTVRIEEFLNYFTYDYAPPADSRPFAAHIEAAACPWKENHRLVRIGLKGKEIAKGDRPLSNLVFLIDVSGSMNEAEKLPFVKEGLKMLVDQLGENDRVAIVVYAGAAGLVLPSTSGEKKSDIIRALDALQAGGSTAGGAGIELAYSVAIDNFIKGATNRVILCSDGDFNVGIQNVGDLQAFIEKKAKSGVFLSVLGFGGGNTRDDIMETLSDKGNGNYAHIDSLKEAQKVFVEQMTGTLITIAKDVKIQVEFNPVQVAAYRLIGYENRILAARDFNDDKKDAGEIGAGHTVTAIYEIVPAGVDVPSGTTDKLRYQKTPEKTEAAGSDELLTLKLRYKLPEGDTSTLQEFPLKDAGQKFGQASPDFKWAAAVASFGMLLRNSPHAGNATYAAVIEMAESAKGVDKQGYRTEFIDLVKKAQQLGQ